MSSAMELTSMNPIQDPKSQAPELGSIPLTANGEATQATPEPTESLSTLRSVFIVITVAGISFLNTLGSGILTVALPRIAEDLHLPTGLLLWPASVYALTSGCTLLIVGTIADVIGNRPVFLTGCALLCAFTLGASLSRTGIELILFRACQGIAMSFCLPTAVGLITRTFPHGRTRNIAFASLGGGQPVGFALGLVVGGLFVDSVGWRYAYFMSCAFNGLIFAAAAFTLPGQGKQINRLQRLMHDIDWIGAIIASTCLSLLSYVFA
jgi:MFS family permease